MPLPSYALFLSLRVDRTTRCTVGLLVLFAFYYHHLSTIETLPWEEASTDSLGDLLVVFVNRNHFNHLQLYLQTFCVTLHGR